MAGTISHMSKPTRNTETRTILAISLPLMAAYVAEMGMMITDMVIVGRLGGNELAAVGLTADCGGDSYLGRLSRS